MLARSTRLTVRRLSPADGSAVFPIVSTPEARRCFPALGMVSASMASSTGVSATASDEWGALIGGRMVALVALSTAPDCVTLSFASAPDLRGEGFATEACALVLARVAAERVGTVRVSAEVSAANWAGGRVLEKLGFWRYGNRLDPLGEVALFRRAVDDAAQDLAVVAEREAGRIRRRAQVAA